MIIIYSYSPPPSASSTSPIRGQPLPATRTYVLYELALAGRPAGQRPPRRAFVRTYGRRTTRLEPRQRPARQGAVLAAAGAETAYGWLVGAAAGAGSSRADDADMARPPRARQSVPRGCAAR